MTPREVRHKLWRGKHVSLEVWSGRRDGWNRRHNYFTFEVFIGDFEFYVSVSL